jgi:multidrug resistance efflux pump
VSWFRRKRYDGPSPFDVAVKELQAKLDALDIEATQTAIATTAMREAAAREHERQQRRIHALTEENAALRQAAVNAETKLDAAQAEVKKLDGENVQLAAELLETSGRLRDAEEQLAAANGHMAMCERADAIAEETAWKRRADV